MSRCGVSSHEIFIVDDDVGICDTLSEFFVLEGYRVRTFRDGASFLGAAHTLSPACVLLDLYMPGKSGLELLDELDARNYPAPIFIMSGRGDIPTAVEAIKAGAHDFIEKCLDIASMVARVRAAINGWTLQQQQERNGSEALSPSFPGCDRLTPRERDVLKQIAAAASNKEAAENLGISRRTVEIHRVHIMQKLGAKNSVDLARIVLNKGRRA
jgi:two-component system, LuxR family, response regulator FixJ